MDNFREKLVRKLQGDIPLVAEPFAKMADELGCSQEDIFQEINAMKKEGIIRRFGAVLGHRHAGFTCNVLAMWEIPESLVDEAGKYMASHREVSHSYLRDNPEKWPYNLYTMIHGRNEEDVDRVVADIAERLKPCRYRLLRSVREFKKTSMVYY